MAFEYHKATSIPEAIALHAAYAGCPVMAGGTDLIVQWRAGALKLKGIVDISSVKELKLIESREDVIDIGACVTHAEIAGDESVRKHVPLLAEACRSIGAIQIQNRGTIGGNIMNASPAGDVPPVLMVYDADLLVQDLKGERWVAARDFFTGYRRTAVGTGELLTRIRFRKADPSDETMAFYKIGTRRAQAISKAVVCIRGVISHGAVEWISIAAGSVAPTVVRAYGTEVLLKGKVITEARIGQARRSFSDELHPIDDVRSTAAYRRFVCGSLIARYLMEAVSKSKSRARP